MITPLISVVIPAYNEEDSLPVFLPKLMATLKNLGTYEIVIVNDGSADKTAEIVTKMHRDNPNIHLISFSRNFGAQAALRAGFANARGDCVISMDADMQHPISAIPEMIKEWQSGCDIVYALRNKTNHLNWFKRVTAYSFYRLFAWLTNMPNNTGADFRLLDRCVVDALKQLPERNLFLRGIIPWLGFRKKAIYYEEAPRLYGGASRYTLRKMLTLALTGILAFSLKPIHLLLGLGTLILMAGLGGWLYVLLALLFSSTPVGSTTLIMCALTTLSGIQLISLGLIGEYIGDISMAVKNRPSYIISKNTLIEKEK